MTHKMWAAMKNYDKWSSRGESIHSGQFMVSQFELDQQEDEDIEISMPDPDETSIIDNIATTNSDLMLPVPVDNKSNNGTIIDISLAKLFKCMTLAYSQKLTSPKWNRFKGVRLRWKDKIRLNNLIWRCWHMQFMMKKNTLVCQFASPLDVDIHSKPEAVVLEGKYWKRQFDVIKAEYMKWRKFHRTRSLGNQCILDTVSEFDVLDWSPVTSEPNLAGGIDDYFWTSDTLFSTINNTNFPFPDAREIAKAGLADFIQPSLGPLQPNLDDFMNPFQHLLSNQFTATRLPPVPEEGGEDAFLKEQYNYPAIMGPEPMDIVSTPQLNNMN